MQKKLLKPVPAKTVPAKTLKEKLMTAIHKVLKEDQSELSAKIQKVVNKAIKKIVKKSDKQIKKVFKAKGLNMAS
ncbi:MAG: hypothetical protein IPI46_05595 [Bacteroidetes bacterium]|nr:hypothetical protein [Bacteroidota bacterium]